MTKTDQQAFEAWLKSFFPHGHAELRRGHNGEYLQTQTRALESAFKIALAHRDAQNPYRQAIEDALIVRELGVAKDDPVAELNELINWEVDVSHDPRVSERARKEQAQLAAVTQQRDELVKAVARWRNQKRRDGARFGPSDSTLDLAFIHFQSTQPQGEWIEIKPDGSNLPPDIEDAEWTIEQRTHDGGRFCGASLTTKEIPSLWRIKPCPREYHVIACWSIPHIDRRPDIPDYQPKEQRDE